MAVLVDQAVILAAGKGTRIGAFRKGQPKSLTRFLGMSLIERNIKVLEKAGIKKIVVVAGFAGDLLQKHLGKIRTRAQLKVVHNPHWEKSNGVSLLAAEEELKEAPFILIMADHVFDPKIFLTLQAAAKPGMEHLCTDSDARGVLDLEDATKVWQEHGRITSIGKDIGRFNAIDTGAFLLTPKFLKYLRELFEEKGDCSITQGVRKAIQEGRMIAVDVTGFFWADIDTREDLKFAKRKFARKVLIKPTDGLISRYLNRRVSIPISTALSRFRFPPNLATAISGVVGVSAGLLVATAKPSLVLVGGILYQLGSILDGVDGELAKMLLKTSRTGEWFDTVADNVSYVTFSGGLAWATWSLHKSEAAAAAGALALLGVILFLTLSYTKLLKENLGGSLLAMHENPRTFWASLLRRDFFAFLFMILSAFNLIVTMTILTAIGAWAGVIWHLKGLFRDES